MLWKKLTCGLVAVVVGVVFAAPLAARGDDAKVQGKGSGHWKEHPVGKFIAGRLQAFAQLHKEVNLTAEQRQKIHQIIASHCAAIAKEAETIWTKRNVLRDAVLAEQTDDEAIRKAADDLGKAIGDAAVKAHKLKGEIAPVLTSEQRDKIKHFIGENDKAVKSFLEEMAKK